MAVEKIGVLGDELSALYEVILSKMQEHEHAYYVLEQQRRLMWNLIGNAHQLPDLDKQKYKVDRSDEGIVLYKIIEDNADAG